MRHWPRELKLGLAVLVLCGALWTLLSLRLAGAGHSPSGPSLFVAPEQHYRWQASWLIPTLLLGWAAACSVVWGVGRGRLTAEPASLAGELAAVIGAALGLALVLPELVAFEVAGFEVLARLLPLTAPLALLGLWGGQAWRLARAGLGRGAAVGGALLASLALLAVLGLVVR